MSPLGGAYWFKPTKSRIKHGQVDKIGYGICILSVASSFTSCYGFDFFSPTKVLVATDAKNPKNKRLAKPRETDSVSQSVPQNPRGPGACAMGIASPGMAYGHGMVMA